MPFQPTGLSRDSTGLLSAFLARHSLSALYRGYSWGRDTWEAGFPDITELETRLVRAARDNLLLREDIVDVAQWGGLTNWSGIRCPETLELPLYEGDAPAKSIEHDPLAPVRLLDEQTSGLGPTYLTKVLRFALPSEFGAIDTRIVRVVGLGDPHSARQKWLSLKVSKSNYGERWAIAKSQSAWPREYQTWTDMLRFLACGVNASCESCPHPKKLLERGLRQEGVWTCADVEMALFSYASTCLDSAT